MNTKYFLYLIIFVLLVLNTVTLMYLFFSKPPSNVEPLSQHPYVSPFAKDIAKDDLMVNLRPLREDILYYLDGIDTYEYSLYIESLNSGANISVNPDLRINPASLSKVPVVMIALKKIENGDWSLDEKFLVKEEDLSSTWGNLYMKGSNYEIPLHELIKLSLEESDNTAHNVIYHNLSPADVTDFADSLGLYELFDAEGNITAKEYSRLFRALYLSSFLSSANSNFILGSLAQTRYNNYLGAGVPSNIPFAHKFGEKTNIGLYADSGIVYIKQRPILITLLLRRKDSEAPQTPELAKEIFRQVSETTISYFSK